MKNLLIFLLLLSATAHSQLQSFVVRSGASGDTLFAYNPSTGDWTQLTKQDTSSLPRFTDKVKGLITWANVQSKPSTYTPSTHSHVIADVTGLQAAIDAKGTSNFDGAYSSLTGKPTLFDGTWSSLTGKPTISGTNTGDQDLSGYTPVTRTINTHPLSANVTVTASDVGLGNVTNESKATMFASPTLTGTITLPAGSIANAALANSAVANLSGTNTGDNAVNSLYSSLVSNATHTGDATGSTALTVVKINGTSLAGLATGILKNTTGTGVPSIAAQSDITALLGAGSITNTMLANAAVANLSGTNSGDQTITLTGDVTGTGTGSFATTIGATKVTNAMLAGSIAYSKLSLTGAILNADLAGSIAASKLIGTDIATLAKNTSYNGVTSVSNGLSQVVATIDATAQTANIATATLYAVPSAGFYRVSIYITITSVGTTSTMPSTTITYTDGNSGTNAHSTTTTATNASNSLTTSFAQATYVLYAKASTNIQYATGSYASTGTPMQYALRIRVEAL